jgi:hypothetical protein
MFAILGWALSSAPTAHVNGFLEIWTVGRHVVSAAAPVLEAARLPLGVGAFVFSAAILGILARALRLGSAPARASP